MKNQAQKGDHCPNCGQDLQGENYCPSCGQKNDVRRITSVHFVNESLSNFLAFDGRFFHTLHQLFRYPGKVASDYIHGKRMQYMNPVRLYFLSSLLLLFILQFEGKSDDIINVKRTEDVEAPSGEPIDSLLSEAEEEGLSVSADEETADENLLSAKLNRMYDFAQDHPGTPIVQALDSLNIDAGTWNNFWYEQTYKMANFDDKEFSEYFFSNLFWVLFFFLPVLAFLLYLLYVRRNFYYPEHLFFTFYSQSAFFILISLGSLLGYLFDSVAFPLLFAMGFGFYLFKSIRRFYGQGFWKSFMKFFFLNILALPVFGIFFLLAAIVVFVLF